jgi:hypothetical protein
MRHEFDAREWGVAGELVIPRPAEPGTVFYTPRISFPEPDWQREREEREARDRDERAAEAAALLEPVDEPSRPDPPAPKQSRWRGAAA